MTVDPKGFESAEAAHDAIMAGGYIRRLMRLLGIKVWVWVLEFHKSGWPHWHILVDLSERGELRPGDLKRVWGLWRDKWGLGGLDLVQRKQFGESKHAVLYITKYLMKPPRSGYPDWFIQGKRRRMVQGARAVGRLCFKGASGSDKPDEQRKRRESRPLVERMAECGKFSHLVAVRVDVETGAEHKRRIGELPVSPVELESLSASGVLPRECGLRIGVVKVAGGTRREIALPSVGQALQLASFLRSMGYSVRHKAGTLGKAQF
ncbi:MAG TPA: hypothetical protein DCX07_01915 [Phycisphaerales bacterium]|nr:hypothetical protein [Phycisphaerales bacterium]